jgi:hypothetical protein
MTSKSEVQLPRVKTNTVKVLRIMPDSANAAPSSSSFGSEKPTVQATPMTAVPELESEPNTAELLKAQQGNGKKKKGRKRGRNSG